MYLNVQEKIMSDEAIPKPRFLGSVQQEYGAAIAAAVADHLPNGGQITLGQAFVATVQVLVAGQKTGPSSAEPIGTRGIDGTFDHRRVQY